MSNGPLNATLTGDGFRFYRWQPIGAEPVDLLSVTSIRKLCGEQTPLVQWQIGNVIDTVMGTVKRPAIGKRGGELKGKNVYVVDEYPSEFVKRYLAADSQQGPLDDLRKWVREQSDQPRNIAAMRGTIVHAALEKNVTSDRVQRAYVEMAFGELSYRDRARAKNGVTDADIAFIHDAVCQYEDMRANVPFVIVAREPQVFNLQHGYGGSADTIIWFLPEGATPADLPPIRTLTLDQIERVGGQLAVGDWKTSKGVYTDQIIQVSAYGAAEFVGSDGIIDRRLTPILQATQKGVLFHIRPTGWGVHTFPFEEKLLRAFFGSVAFARFLATYPDPTALFASHESGNSVIKETE